MKQEEREMLLTKKLKMGLFAFTMLFVVAAATSASAESGTKDAQRQVADRLAEFRRTASQLHREADTFNSRRLSRVSWQTHARHLGNITDHVNQLGKSLAELEALRPAANESQRMAIEHARPHLVSIAQSTTRAMELLKDNRGSIHFPEYGEAAGDIYDHADSLYTKLDAILDFENAKARLDELELQPKPSEGS
jgi:Spy/CpxP family protein refolding chaperone